MSIVIKKRENTTWSVKDYLSISWLIGFESNLEPRLNYHLAWLNRQGSVKIGLVYLLIICSPLLLINLSPCLLQMFIGLVREGVNLTTSSWFIVGDSSSNVIDSLEDLNPKKFLLSESGISEDSRNFWKVRHPLNQWLKFVYEEEMLRLTDSLNNYSKLRWEATPFNLMGVFNWEKEQDNLDFLMELAGYLMREEEQFKWRNGLEGFLKLNVEDNLSSKLRNLENLRSSGDLDKFIQLVMDNIKLNNYMFKLSLIHQEIQVSLDDLTEALKELNLLSRIKELEELDVQGWVDNVLTELKDMKIDGDKVNYQKLKNRITYNHNLYLTKILSLIEKVEVEFNNPALSDDQDIRQQELTMRLIKLRDSNDEHNVLHSFPYQDPHCKHWKKLINSTENGFVGTVWDRERVMRSYLSYFNETSREVKLVITESLDKERYTIWQGYYSPEDQVKLEVLTKLNLLEERLGNFFISWSKNGITIQNQIEYRSWKIFVHFIKDNLEQVNKLLNQVIGQEQSQVVKMFNGINKTKDWINIISKV